jgi:hypothetical protein
VGNHVQRAVLHLVGSGQSKYSFLITSSPDLWEIGRVVYYLAWVKLYRPVLGDSNLIPLVRFLAKVDFT